jgi:hypothetical protein
MTNIEKLEVKCALVCILALVATLLTLALQNHPHYFHVLIIFDIFCVGFACHVFNKCAQ